MAELATDAQVADFHAKRLAGLVSDLARGLERKAEEIRALARRVADKRHGVADEAVHAVIGMLPNLPLTSIVAAGAELAAADAAAKGKE